MSRVCEVSYSQKLVHLNRCQVKPENGHLAASADVPGDPGAHVSKQVAGSGIEEKHNI